MKEWSHEEAVQVILNVIMEETSEDSLNDVEAEKLARKIATALESA